MNEREQSELFELLGGWCQGALDDGQFNRLESLLESSPSARAIYVNYLDLHSELMWTPQATTGAVPVAEQPPALPERALVAAPRKGSCAAVAQGIRYLSSPGRFGLTVATVTCVSLLLFFAQIRFSTSDAPQPPSTAAAAASSSTVGWLLSAEDCRWGGGATPARALQPGQELDLREGTAEIRFASGAQVHLVGPSRMRLDTATLGRLFAGQIAVTAPPRARGFTVRTTGVEIIDLGTEFAVVVDEEQAAAVSVQRGFVRVQSTNREHSAGDRQVAVGESVEVDAQGVYRPVSPVMAQRLLALPAVRNSLQETLSQDTGLLVYYGPSSDEGATVKNLARTGAAYDGVLLGGAWRDLPDGSPTPALRLDGTRTGVTFDVPDELTAFTFVLRVRLDPPPQNQPVAALLMSQGWYVPGMVHWQVRDGSLVSFAVYNKNEHNVTLPSSQLTNRRVHLALVYDQSRGRVATYVDAEPVYEAVGQSLPGVHLGPATLGAYYDKGAEHSTAERRMTGDLAEFMLFRRALTAGEVGYLYRDGKSLAQGDATPTAPNDSSRSLDSESKR